MKRIVGSGWEELSDWYDKKEGDEGDLWHRALIDPPLIKIVGNCRGRDVLDLGCGNGYLARKFAKKGARVTAVDSSPRMIQNAKAHDPENLLKVRYLQSDAGRLVAISEACFDIVYANMSLMDMENAKGAIREVSRVLRRGGRFVASICHPCFDNGSNSGWIMERSIGEPAKVFRRIRAYRSVSSERFPWRIRDRGFAYTVGFHRPINWYANALGSNKLGIIRIEEPMPMKEFLVEETKNPSDLDALGSQEVPLHLVFEAVKL